MEELSTLIAEMGEALDKITELFDQISDLSGAARTLRRPDQASQAEAPTDERSPRGNSNRLRRLARAFPAFA
jgi:hypothetical protein